MRVKDKLINSMLEVVRSRHPKSKVGPSSPIGPYIRSDEEFEILVLGSVFSGFVYRLKMRRAPDDSFEMIVDRLLDLKGNKEAAALAVTLIEEVMKRDPSVEPGPDSVVSDFVHSQGDIREIVVVAYPQTRFPDVVWNRDYTFEELAFDIMGHDD